MLVLVMAMKYICFDNGMFDEIVIFTDNNDHRQFALDKGITENNILSAGFVTYYSDGLECYGTSISLKKNSRGKEDTDLLMRMIES